MAVVDETPRILAVIALDEEYEAFLNSFPLRQDFSTDTQMLFEHEVADNQVKLFSILSNKMGAKSSGFATENAIKTFKPHAVIVIGIAGGLTNDVKVGDVCISNEIIDVLHNNKVVDCVLGSKKKESISFSPDFHPVDADYISTFRFLKIHPNLKHLYSEWKADAKRNELEIGVTNTNLEYDLQIGAMVCGPVSASKAFNEKLKGIDRKFIAIETESGGVFSVCEQHKVPAIAIRGISDMADANKNILENENSGNYRKLAMENAIDLLKIQLKNKRFYDFLKKKSLTQTEDIGTCFDLSSDIVPRLDREIKARLREVCASFHTKSENFYFPLPRIQKFISGNNPVEGEINSPEIFQEALKENKRIFVKIPRTFSGINLGLYLSYHLIRAQIDDKQILPILVDGKQISPPNKGLNRNSPDYLRDEKLNSELFTKVYIIEEPEFTSFTKTNFLKLEILKENSYIIILSKTEDKAGTIDGFLNETETVEYTTTRISFSETAIFLEKTFDMQPFEAESVAIRLENTFRKFKIEVDPSYFTLIQQDTLIALINANKRAELIQFAVQGLLSLIVAYDPSAVKLSRTTRERFLERICKYKIERQVSYIQDTDLAQLASDYLQEFAYDIDQSEFLSPFFKSGLLYVFHGRIYFSYPYLESYLIARTLRNDERLAIKYFNPEEENFDIYSFDLYSEMGPSDQVINTICQYAEFFVALANETYGSTSVYDDKKSELNNIVNSVNISKVSESINKMADKLQKSENSNNIRVEKQKILDTQNHVITSYNKRKKDNDVHLEKNIQEEFYVLDGLSRASVATLTLLGSGAESINKIEKEKTIDACMKCNERFASVWTINRLRMNFKTLKDEMLSDKNVEEFIKEMDLDRKDLVKIKKDINVFISLVQSNVTMEPISRILNNICSIAGVRVLSPIVSSYQSDNPLVRVLKSIWLMEAHPSEGYEAIKESFSTYRGANIVRIASSYLLLNRLYWLHYQTSNSGYFSNAAKRVVAPVGVSYNQKTLENAMKGPNKSSQ